MFVRGVARRTSTCPDKTIGPGLRDESFAEGGVATRDILLKSTFPLKPLGWDATRAGHTVGASTARLAEVVVRVAAVVFEERAPLGPARDVVVLWILVGIWHMGEALTGTKLKGSIDFGFDEPAYFERFKPLLAGPARFSQPLSQLLFDSSVLDLPLVFHDPSAVQLALQQCERQLDALGYHQRTSSSVRQLIHLEERFQTLEETAQLLHVSPRTLKRKLKSEGTSYTELVDEARREKALLLIHSPRLSLEAIAERVGYADVSNFTRAFRRWTGMTPAVFRASGKGA